MLRQPYPGRSRSSSAARRAFQFAQADRLLSCSRLGPALDDVRTLLRVARDTGLGVPLRAAVALLAPLTDPEVEAALQLLCALAPELALPPPALAALLVVCGELGRTDSRFPLSSSLLISPGGSA